MHAGTVAEASVLAPPHRLITLLHCPSYRGVLVGACRQSPHRVLNSMPTGDRTGLSLILPSLHTRRYLVFFHALS